MTAKIVFEAKNVGVSYRQRLGLLKYQTFWGLSDISFRLHAGETLGVIGGNGAGKSTLLRLIAGIIEQDRGSVKRDHSARASLLALNAGFRPELAGRDNAILSGMLLGMSYADVKKRLPEIEEFCGIGDFFDQPVAVYSTGMRARLGFAVAVCADPDILLIDEVLGVGDQAFQEKSSEAMRQKINSNKTVVLVSHSMAAVSELCDTVLWIHKGCTVGMGDTDYIISEYDQAVRDAVEMLLSNGSAESLGGGEGAGI